MSEQLASNVLLAKAYLTDAHAILKSACSKEGAGFDLAAAAYKVVEAIRLLESGAAPEPAPSASKEQLTQYDIEMMAVAESVIKYLLSPRGQEAARESARRCEDTAKILAKGRDIPWEKLHEPFTI